jgi:hypothetical protein
MGGDSLIQVISLVDFAWGGLLDAVYSGLGKSFMIAIYGAPQA